MPGPRFCKADGSFPPKTCAGWRLDDAEVGPAGLEPATALRPTSSRKVKTSQVPLIKPVESESRGIAQLNAMPAVARAGRPASFAGLRHVANNAAARDGHPAAELCRNARMRALVAGDVCCATGTSQYSAPGMHSSR
jgi:hypothetical protein